VSNLTEFWLSSPVEVIVFGGGLALLIYLLFFSQPTSVPLASNETGKLLISRKALHRLVEACCGQVKGVASASASIKFKQDRLNTKIRLKVRPEAKLDAIQGYLTQEITEYTGRISAYPETSDRLKSSWWALLPLSLRSSPAQSPALLIRAGRPRAPWI
jgi:hypothetical protein